MCFSYPDEVEDNRFMWCCGVVERVKTRGEKVIKVYIKWDEQFVACGESGKMEEILKKTFVGSQHTEERGVDAERARILEDD